jgi:hypothetical protein
LTASPPVAGTVFRYAYLWAREADEGFEEGLKSRPAVVIAVAISEREVVALAITHTAPADKSEAVEIPSTVKRSLHLDSERSWIVVSEANIFKWPGPDIRMIPGADPPTAIFGRIPPALLQRVARALLSSRKRQRLRLVQRTA